MQPPTSASAHGGSPSRTAPPRLGRVQTPPLSATSPAASQYQNRVAAATIRSSQRSPIWARSTFARPAVPTPQSRPSPRHQRTAARRSELVSSPNGDLPESYTASSAAQMATELLARATTSTMENRRSSSHQQTSRRGISAESEVLPNQAARVNTTQSTVSGNASNHLTS